MTDLHDRPRMRQALWLLAILLALTSGACKTAPPERKVVSQWEADFNMRAAKAFAEDPNVRTELRRRAEEAVRKLENGVPDPEPILVQAELSDVGPFLRLVVIDEQHDLLGICVKEMHSDPNGAVSVLEEDYPVFEGLLAMPTPGPDAVVVQLRTQHQRKHENLWREYVTRIRAASPSERAAHTRKNVASLAETMPPVWISVPDSSTSVTVSVYDRAGNRSDHVPVEWVQWLNL